jgi:DnaK suppressor protein
MEPSEIQSFGRILGALVGAQDQPLWRRDEIAVDKSPDIIDQGQRATERELAIQHLEHNQRRLQEAKAALQRIENGTYGACVRCDAEISMKRLIAVPWTSYCLVCQDLADRERSKVATLEITPASYLEEDAA